jgi:hypothetical protein
MFSNLLTDSIAAGILTYLPQLRAGGIREVDICGDDNERAVSSGYVEQLDSQPLRWNYLQRARKRAAAPAESATEASVGAAAGDNVLVESSSVRAAAAAAVLMENASAGSAQKATEVSAGVAAGPTAVLVGSESTGAAEEITLAGKLSRKQAKNIKQRMNKMKVLYCPSN